MVKKHIRKARIINARRNGTWYNKRHGEVFDVLYPAKENSYLLPNTPFNQSKFKTKEDLQRLAGVERDYFCFGLHQEHVRFEDFIDNEEASMLLREDE